MVGKFIRTSTCEYNPVPLVQARKSLGLSVRAAAEKLGIHYVTLSKIENGSDTTEEMIESIIHFYGLPLSAIIVVPSEVKISASI